MTHELVRFSLACSILATACCAPAVATQGADSARVLDAVSARIAVGGAAKLTLRSPAGATLIVADEQIVSNGIEGATAEVNSPEDVNEMDESPPVVVSIELTRVLAGKWVLSVERSGDAAIDVNVIGKVRGGKSCEAGDLSEGPSPKTRTWGIRLGRAPADSCMVRLSPLPAGTKRK